MELPTVILGGLANRFGNTHVVDDREAWDVLVDGVSGGQILQSFQWGAFKARYGWFPVRVAHFRRGTPVAAAQVLLKRTPVGPIAYVPRGPLVSPGAESVLPEFVTALHRVVQEHRVVRLTVEPEWTDNRDNVEHLKSLDFFPSEPVQPRTTLILDLRRDAGALLASMNPRTRHNVRLASRRGVSVDVGGDGDLPAFYNVLADASRRNHFPINEFAFYDALWRDLAPSGQARLLVARHGGQALSVGMILTMGKAAYYMYGGSSSLARGVRPSDLLQWEAIRRAREHGCVTYDFWGVPDEVGHHDTLDADPALAATRVEHHPSRSLWGVYHFKRGFGGRPVRYVGAYSYVYQPRRHWLWQVLAPHVRAVSNLFER